MSSHYIPVGLTPRQTISAYSADQWEEFVTEWASSLTSYVKVEHVPGAGDKGRDVICLVSEPQSAGQWDNYQCKHYNHPLHPSDVWLELGKLCFYTHNGAYPMPRAYRFVAPHDVGTKLNYLLQHPDKLREQLIDEWPTKCERHITASSVVKLEGSLRTYVDGFDFSIVGFKPVHELLEQHRATPHWHVRFKQALPPRPGPSAVPNGLQIEEAVYVRKLLDAYAEACGNSIQDSGALANVDPKFHQHLKRSRLAFFRAEQLNRFSRDHFPADAFGQLKQQVFDGIIDTVESRSHANGFARVVEATKIAAALQLGNCELKDLAEVADRHGACHHLANDGAVTWVQI